MTGKIRALPPALPMNLSCDDDITAESSCQLVLAHSVEINAESNGENGPLRRSKAPSQVGLVYLVLSYSRLRRFLNDERLWAFPLTGA